MFGFLIPRNYIEALEFDKANNNSKLNLTKQTIAANGMMLQKLN